MKYLRLKQTAIYLPRKKKQTIILAFIIRICGCMLLKFPEMFISLFIEFQSLSEVFFSFFFIWFSSMQHAIVYVQGDKYYGAKATINVWKPNVQQSNEFSLSQIWLLSGTFGQDLNSIEAGWQVYILLLNLISLKHTFPVVLSIVFLKTRLAQICMGIRIPDSSYIGQ